MNAAQVGIWIDQIYENNASKLDSETNKKVNQSRKNLKEKLELLKTGEDVPREITDRIDRLRIGLERPRPDAEAIKKLILALEFRIWKPSKVVDIEKWIEEEIGLLAELEHKEKAEQTDLGRYIEETRHRLDRLKDLVKM